MVCYSEIYTFVDIVHDEYLNIIRTVSTRCHVRNVSLVHIVGRSMDAFLFIYVHREERKKRCVEDPPSLASLGRQPKAR